jgi:hypothetical protein
LQPLYKGALWGSDHRSRPFIVVSSAGGTGNVSIQMAAVAVVLSAAGWVSGLWISDHPLIPELLRARDALIRSGVGKLVGVLGQMTPGYESR